MVQNKNGTLSLQIIQTNNPPPPPTSREIISISMKDLARRRTKIIIKNESEYNLLYSTSFIDFSCLLKRLFYI